MKSRSLTLIILFTATCLSFGQFSTDWSTIDGGGSTSTNGQYAITGTIGQPDAGPRLSGGDYSLDGGFWALISVIQSPGAPTLSIAVTASNTVAVYWPSPSPGWQLQENATSVSSVNWSNVLSAPDDDGTNKTVVINPPVGNRFYRLFKP